MHLLFRSVILAAFLGSLSIPSAPAAEGEKGFFGFALEIDGSGFFLNPTLRAITVKSVVPSSPAARAGITAGDQIIEAEGHIIAGAKARDLQPIMQRQVGQTMHLRLKRTSGAEYAITLVAVARPPSP